MFQPGVNYREQNQQYRSREYLTHEEVKRLIQTAGLRGRHPVRDPALILIMFRHGLRATEAAHLKWDAIMGSSIYVQRVKHSICGTHPLQSDELELLKELRSLDSGSRYVFPNERGEHISMGAIAKMIERAGELSQLGIKVHPHMLRHSCGYYLAELGMPTRDIQEYLGHSNIQNTVRYTAGNPARFSKIQWELIKV